MILYYAKLRVARPAKFVSPAVSPGQMKMGVLLITYDDRDYYSTGLKAGICSLWTTAANSSKNAVSALGNLRSIGFANSNALHDGRRICTH